MPRIMAIGNLGVAAGVGAYPQDFGPWVEASDVDAALQRASAQMQTGRPPTTPVAYKFSPDGHQWTEEYFDAATSQTHTVDHTDPVGQPLLRAAYESILASAGSPAVKALGTSTWTFPILLAAGAAGAFMIWWFGFRRHRRRR